MKKISKVLVMIFTVILVSTKSLAASSYNLNVNPEKINAKPGQTVEIKIDLTDIDMGQKGVNAVEGYINYDEDIIEGVEIKNQNDWNMIYNSEKSSELYGKFLSLKDVEGIKSDENIAILKLKIKDEIKKQEAIVTFSNITSNDDQNLVNIDDRKVVISFDKSDINIVNTGNTFSILIIAVFSVMILICVINIIITITNRKAIGGKK